jgi:hypothetical protein
MLFLYPFIWWQMYSTLLRQVGMIAGHNHHQCTEIRAVEDGQTQQ